MALHCALHCGELCEMHVGTGHEPGGRFCHFVTGEALLELKPLIGAAGPEQVCASAAFWRLLPPGAPLAEPAVRAPSGWLLAKPESCPGAPGADVEAATPSAAAVAALGLYLPPYLREVVRCGRAGWLAEMRRVSCVFFSLPSLGVNDFELAQALLTELHHTVSRAGGSVVQSITDDKARPVGRRCPVRSSRNWPQAGDRVLRA